MLREHIIPLPEHGNDERVGRGSVADEIAALRELTLAVEDYAAPSSGAATLEVPLAALLAARTEESAQHIVASV